MIHISAVSYLNTAPFIYGIKHSGLLHPEEFSLQRDIPSACASRLLNQEAHIGIVPVSILPRLETYHPIGNTCIGARDHIDSVMLFSKVPIQEIRGILLDWHSRTSVNLCRVLASEYWKIEPEWLHAQGEFVSEIQGNTAAVIIGDRAMALAGAFPYAYDLAKEWFQFSGLPFVFACWMANNRVPEDFARRFELALQYGLNHLDQVVEEEISRYPSQYQVEKYLKQTVSYIFDAPKKQALETFLTLSGKLRELSPA